MVHSFDTIADAVEAGYRTAHKQHLETFVGYEISVSDTSGQNAYGYRFGVVAIPTQGRVLGPWGTVVSVWTHEKNRLGQPGCCLSMFPPDELDKAVEQAKAAVTKAISGMDSAGRDACIMSLHQWRCR